MNNRARFNATRAAVVCAALFVSRLLAEVHFVDLNNPLPVSPFTNWDTAATDIQSAIDAASNGDIILVTNGIYQTGEKFVTGTTTNRVTVTKLLLVQSVNGPAVTVIKGYRVPGVTNGPSSIRCVSLVDGATLSGFTLTGGSTYTDGGAGVICHAPNTIVTNCVIEGNAAKAGGGGGFGGTYLNCVVRSNYTVLYGAGLNGGSAQNCLIVGNSSSSSGGGTYYTPMTNCTVVGNYSLVGGGGGIYGANAMNCIIYYNMIGTPGSGGTNAYNATLVNCCTTITNFASVNCITNAAAFVDLSGGNLRLQIGSPCVDAGNSAFATADLDLDNNLRIFGSAVDMGAYENQFQGTIHYVSLNSMNPVPPFTNWMTAATNIQDAVAVALDSEYVVADAGVYTNGGVVIYGAETNRVALTNAITLLGVYGPSATIIRGGTRMRGAYVGSNAVLNGFTLTNGQTGTGGDTIKELSGAGIWCETGGTVSNCLVTGNHCSSGGGRGGGIYGGTIYNSILTNNVAGFGGAAASASLFNCTIASNSAPYSPPFGYGGGAYQSTLSNCTLVANGWGYGTTGGGAYQSLLYNCTLLTNLSTYGGGGAHFSMLSNCTLKWNLGNAGGTSSSTNYNCLFVGNSGPNGGGLSGGVAYDCILSNNTAQCYGGGAYQAALYNCLLTANRTTNGSFSSYGGGGAYQGTLYNCTVTSNSAAATGGGVYGSTLYNSILYYNSAPSGSNYASGVGGGFFYCCTMPFPGGPGCFTNAPVFVNLAAGDLHQETNSPCINGGFNNYVTNSPMITADLDGNPRLIGGTVDVGAYEYQGSNLGLPIPIPWLRQYSLPTDGSANYADADNDGFNNWQEWIAGTIPTDNSSLLQMFSPANTNNPSGLIVSWKSVSGVNYFLQRSDDLNAQPPFQTIATDIVGQPSMTIYTDITATNSGPYFYRVGVQ